MTPKISCIMPTYNRREFIPQALKYFERQDYPNKELIIVDDGTDTIADLLQSHLDITYILLSERCTVGMKRNIACSLATGEIICTQDDDDYYGPKRLSQQVKPILAGHAHVPRLFVAGWAVLPLHERRRGCAFSVRPHCQRRETRSPGGPVQLHLHPPRWQRHGRFEHQGRGLA